MKQLVRNVKIIGTGSYVPEIVYTNEYLETKVPTSAQWIYENVGIKERHIAADNQATSDLAAEAGRKAIENAGLKPDDIELIIVATSTPDRKAPSTAAFVQHKLQAKNAAAAGEVVEYTNCADKTGDLSHCVGYAGIAFR